jgi:hypothetical protein
MSTANIDRFNELKNEALAITDLMQVAGESRVQLAKTTLIRIGYMLEKIVVEMKQVVDEVTQAV